MAKIEYYLAGDPAKQHDYFGIVVLKREDKNIILKAHNELQLDYNIVANYIEALNRRYKFIKIFLDETGVGAVFLDMLNAKKLKVEGITLSNPKKIEILETTIRLQHEGRLKLPRIGAKELKQQLQQQERDLTQSGMVCLVHPSNAYDDLFWAFCIGCYGAKKMIDVPKSFGISYQDIEAKESTEEGRKAQGEAWVQRGNDNGSTIGRKIDFQ